MNKQGQQNWAAVVAVLALLLVILFALYGYLKDDEATSQLLKSMKGNTADAPPLNAPVWDLPRMLALVGGVLAVLVICFLIYLFAFGR